jgi:c-di-AMP phosphodiesterase-like protein
MASSYIKLERICVIHTDNYPQFCNRKVEELTDFMNIKIEKVLNRFASNQNITNQQKQGDNFPRIFNLRFYQLNDFFDNA